MRIFSKVLNRATESKVQNRDIYTTSSVVRLKSEYMKIGNFEKFWRFPNHEISGISMIINPKILPGEIFLYKNTQMVSQSVN